MIRLAWRLLGRELRSGELRLLFAALAIAVASVTAVGFFADRIRLALEQEAQQLMGSDLLLIADQPWSREISAEAGRRGLQVAETLTFPSMVMAGEQLQLADVKAVSSTYPLRGQLAIAAQPGAASVTVDRGPMPGSVWLDERLLSALKTSSGELLAVGLLNLKVAGVLTQEPDRGVNVFTLAPRLMMHLDDLPASGLVQEGARITYRLLLAGDAARIADFRVWVEPRLLRGQRLENTQNARPEIRNALDRAQRFLGLATLLTVILSAVAVALAARRYMQRHLDACAVMRCLGLTQRRLFYLHLLLYCGLALLAAGFGNLLGFATHFVLTEWLSGWLGISLPLPGWWPIIQGSAVAGVLLLGFALPPLLQLGQVPVLRVLRRELGAPKASLLGGYFFGLLMLAGLILVVAGDWRMGGLAIAGFGSALGIFWLIAWLAVRAMAGLRHGGGFGWRQGLANLSRHGPSSSLQIVALAVGMMAMLLLTVTRGELLDAWRKATPPDAPNRFVINIQPEQRDGLISLFADAGIQAELAPMARARLLKIGERSVSAATYPEDERAQRLIEREFNVSWRQSLPPGNSVVAGRWFLPEESGQGLASVESGLAKTLGIQLGDELLFSVGGVEKTLRVSNLRKLDWESMRVNFFVLAPPAVMDEVATSYITSFHLPAEKAAFGARLLAQYPNLTLIDVSAVLRQLESVVSQVSAAIQFIFIFTLAAGGAVLYSALFSAFDERRHELALMRALGAQRRQLRQAMLVELAVIGALAGLMAALGAEFLGQLLARQAFQIELSVSYRLPVLSALAGAALSTSAGWLALRSLLSTPPLLSLRNGA